MESIQARLKAAMPDQVAAEAVAAGMLLIQSEGGESRQQNVFTGRSGEDPTTPRGHPAEPEVHVQDPGIAPIGEAPLPNVGRERLIYEEMERLRATEQYTRSDQRRRNLDASRRERAERNVNEAVRSRKRNPDFDASDVEGGDHGHQPGTRAHDAEAQMLRHIEESIAHLEGQEPHGPVRDELHIMTNFPTCPACLALIFRFGRRFPSLRVYTFQSDG